MYLNRRELEELKDVPFWDRVAMPRFLHVAVGALITGGALLSFDLLNPAVVMEFLYVLPVPLRWVGWFVVGLGGVSLVLWSVATIRKLSSG